MSTFSVLLSIAGCGGLLRTKFSRCTQSPVTLQGPPGEKQSRGCVVTYEQEVRDEQARARLGATSVERRYLVYTPSAPPSRPLPVVLVFPGYGASAEAAAFYYTHLRFEILADQHQFIVVYGNGLPNRPPGESGKDSLANAGYFQGCFIEHDGEGVDVGYVRDILDQLEKEFVIDRRRVYATGLSAGGGLSFQLALEAPDLVAAIAPIAPLPFQPSGPWRYHCNVKPGHNHIPIMMLAATSDPFISYTPGGTREYPSTQYPGMEETRDAWLSSMKIKGPPNIQVFPDIVNGDSHYSDSGRESSYLERSTYSNGPDGQAFVYYKAVGMGHWWPHPKQMWGGLWSRFGKTNQDVDFSGLVWEFFQKYEKPTASR